MKVQRPQNLTKKTVEEIENFCMKKKALFVKIEPTTNKDISLLKDLGYTNSAYPLLAPTTLVINLQKDKTVLWNEVSKSGTYSIRRAQREGCKFEACQKPSEEKIKIALNLMKETGRAKHIIVPSLAV